MSSPAIFADPTTGSRERRCSIRRPTARRRSIPRTIAGAPSSTRRVRGSRPSLSRTAADTARCIAEVDSLAKEFDVDLTAGRGGRDAAACPAAAAAVGRRAVDVGGRGRGGADAAAGDARRFDARQVHDAAVDALPQLAPSVEQVRHDGVSHAGRRAGKAVRRRVAVRAAHADAVPRHHGVSGRRSRRRRVRRHGSLARHSRHAEPDAHRRSRRLELLLLALGDVQQRRVDGAVLRRVGRRRRGVLPRRTTRRTGAPTRFSRS